MVQIMPLTIRFRKLSDKPNLFSFEVTFQKDLIKRKSKIPYNISSVVEENFLRL